MAKLKGFSPQLLHRPTVELLSGDLKPRASQNALFDTKISTSQMVSVSTKTSCRSFDLGHNSTINTETNNSTPKNFNQSASFRHIEPPQRLIFGKSSLKSVDVLETSEAIPTTKQTFSVKFVSEEDLARRPMPAMSISQKLASFSSEVVETLQTVLLVLLMMGDIAIRRILFHVTKAVSCSRPPLATASSCPFRQHAASLAAPASSLAVPSPEAMSSPEPNSPTPTAMHGLARGEEKGFGANTLSHIAPAASVLSPQQTTASPAELMAKDSSSSPSKSGASTNFYGSPSSPQSSAKPMSPVNACPVSERQATCPHAAAARANDLGDVDSSANSNSSPVAKSSRHVSPHGQTQDSVENIRPFTDLPCPPGWPIIGSFLDYFKEENQGQMHELMRRRHREFGKIFREQFGPRQNVVIADPNLMAEVCRKEGKYPSRPPYESWVLYKKLRRKDGGLMTSEKEYWKKSRGVLATKLRPRAVADYVPMLNEVCSDFLARIGLIKVPGPDSHTTNSHTCPQNNQSTTMVEPDNSDRMSAPHTIPRMMNELNKFTMETILYVMLNTRVGCLEPELNEQVDAFIRSISTMFLTGHQLMVYANIHKLLSTRPWREHVQSWDSIYEFASHHVNKGIDEVTRELESTSASTGEEPISFLKYVVGTQQLSRAQIVDNIIEVFMGGIDTTANALAFLFYLLSKNSSVQERLVAEVDSVIGGRTPSSEDLQRMPFLKACVKETLRLFPPIPTNARTTTEDCTLGGYHIPKDTILMLNLYVMSRDEKIFTNPDEFHPERWLREGRDENQPLPHPFSLLPFGSGVRSCVGRRVAEVQIYLATIQVLQRYSLKKSDVFDIKPCMRTQLTPGPELPVMFLER